MRDRDIRLALLRNLHDEHKHDPTTLVLDELGLCQGRARVDVAVINGSINGYEIKSERDTLDRLPGQKDVYSKALNNVTIVASSSHLIKIKNIVPDWWGILEAVSVDDDISFLEVREARNNPSIDPFALAQLLWRNEAVQILAEKGLDKKTLSKPRRILWQKLSELCTLDELNFLVRSRLKSRQNWRSGELQKSCDD